MMDPFDSHGVTAFDVDMGDDGLGGGGRHTTFEDFDDFVDSHQEGNGGGSTNYDDEDDIFSSKYDHGNGPSFDDQFDMAYDGNPSDNEETSTPYSEGQPQFSEGGTDNDNDNRRFSKDQQQEADIFSDSSSSKNDATADDSDGKRKPPQNGTSPLAHGASSTPHGGLAALAEAAEHDHSTSTLQGRNGSNKGTAFHQHQRGATAMTQSRQGSGESVGTMSFLDPNIQADRRQDRKYEAALSTSKGSFNQIIPMPRRSAPGNGAGGGPRPHSVHLQPQRPQQPPAMDRRPNGMEQRQLPQNSNRSVAPRSGMNSFNGPPSTTAMGGHLKQQEGHSRQSHRPGLPTVSPHHYGRKEGTGAHNHGAIEQDDRGYSDEVPPSTRPTIDMGYATGEYSECYNSQETRRVSFEDEHKRDRKYESEAIVWQEQDNPYQDPRTASMSEQQQERQRQGRFRAQRRNSVVIQDAQSLSMDTTEENEEATSSVPMDESYQEGMHAQSTMDEGQGYYDENDNMGQEWNVDPGMERSVDERYDEEVGSFDPSLFSFEGQSQAFTEAHEQTEDLQGEISADLQKMMVQFCMDYPKLLHQCDEMVELWNNCEELEWQADDALNRYENVMTAIQVEIEEGDMEHAKAMAAMGIEQEDKLEISQPSGMPVVMEIDTASTEIVEDEKDAPFAHPHDSGGSSDPTKTIEGKGNPYPMESASHGKVELRIATPLSYGENATMETVLVDEAPTKHKNAMDFATSSHAAEEADAAAVALAPEESL